jgi:hypothetical protein
LGPSSEKEVELMRKCRDCEHHGLESQLCHLGCAALAKSLNLSFLHQFPSCEMGIIIMPAVVMASVLKILQRKREMRGRD